MDKKRDAEDAAGATGEEEAEEPFRFGDILDIITLKGFWYMALLCVLFYSAVFPFLKYAPNLISIPNGPVSFRLCCHSAIFS